jgi:hypothetical protein
MRAEPYITSIEPTRASSSSIDGLSSFELEAHGPEFVAQQELGIAERQAIGRVARLRGIGRRGFGKAGLLLRAVELAALEVAFGAFGLFDIAHSSLPVLTHPPRDSRPEWEARAVFPRRRRI